MIRHVIVLEAIKPGNDNKGGYISEGRWAFMIKKSVINVIDV